MTLLKK